MQKMGSGIWAMVAGFFVAGSLATTAIPAQAGDYGGDFLVRVQGTYVNFNDESTALPGSPGGGA